MSIHYCTSCVCLLLATPDTPNVSKNNCETCARDNDNEAIVITIMMMMMIMIIISARAVRAVLCAQLPPARRPFSGEGADRVDL